MAATQADTDYARLTEAGSWEAAQAILKALNLKRVRSLADQVGTESEGLSRKACARVILDDLGLSQYRVVDAWEKEPLIQGSRQDVSAWLAGKRCTPQVAETLLVRADNGQNSRFMLTLGTQVWVERI